MAISVELTQIRCCSSSSILRQSPRSSIPIVLWSLNPPPLTHRLVFKWRFRAGDRRIAYPLRRLCGDHKYCTHSDTGFDTNIQSQGEKWGWHLNCCYGRKPLTRTTTTTVWIHNNNNNVRMVLGTCANTGQPVHCYGRPQNAGSWWRAFLTVI